MQRQLLICCQFLTLAVFSSHIALAQDTTIDNVTLDDGPNTTPEARFESALPTMNPLA